jgi:GDP-4-dehydro-6-deoxy-D-mannose reductase
MKKVLITGITGMIGSHIARVLTARGDEVHGLVRWRSNLHNLAGILDKVHTHMGDIQDHVLIRKTIRKIQPDIIFHFAAQAFNGVSWDSPQYTLSVNIFGTLNILETLREDNNTTTRLLIGCSSTEYGETTRDWTGPIPEDAPLQPVTPYGVSKVAQEMLGKQYFFCYGIPAIIVRIFNQAGTGHTESAAIQEFCRQIALIERGLQEPVLKVGYLGAKRDFTDIRDSAPVFVQTAEKGVPGEVYNLASGHAVSMQDMLDVALDLSPQKITLQHDESRMRPYDENVLLGDNRKIRALTGWTPKTDLTRSIKDILDYWRGEIALRYPSDSERA